MDTLNQIIGKSKLNITDADIETIKTALQNMSTVKGTGDMGSRASKILTNIHAGDVSVNLPEWNTIGMALSRLDTPQAYVLLNKITHEITGLPTENGS